MALFLGYNGLKTWILETFQKKQPYHLSVMMHWYYATYGGNPLVLRSGQGLPIVTLSKKTRIKILCHNFDDDGSVPDNVKIDYRLYYVTKEGTASAALLGTLTLGKAVKNFNNFWGVTVNHTFDLSSLLNDVNNPTNGYIHLTCKNIPKGNEHCMTVCFYEPTE